MKRRSEITHHCRIRGSKRLDAEHSGCQGTIAEGTQRDWATNLDDAKARTYHHNRGRFMQPDPLGIAASDLRDPQSLNRYSYVQNDLVNFVDPSGLCIVVARYIGNAEIGNGEYRLEFYLCNDAGGGGGGGGGGGMLPGGGGGQSPQNPTSQKNPPCNPGYFDTSKNYVVNKPDSQGEYNNLFSGDDLNYAARAVFAEAAGVADGGTDEEVDAMASVLYNRLGQRGYPGGVQSTLKGVADAIRRNTKGDPITSSSQFRAVTGPEGETRKFRRSANLDTLSSGDCNDLRRAVDAVRRLVNGGPKYAYTHNRAGTTRTDLHGDRIGGSRFGYAGTFR